MNCSGLIEPIYNSSIFACLPDSYEGAYTIPEGITKIGSDAFSGCSGLTSITIPNSVTSIEESAFYGCDNLSSIEILNNVTSIGCNAFEYCKNLTSLIIPNSVTSIGAGAFLDCSRLIALHCLCTNPPDIHFPDLFFDEDYDSSSLYGLNPITILYVPKGSIEAYRKAKGWNVCRTIVEE